MYSCDAKDEFSAGISPDVNVTWSFRNHYDMLIWRSKKRYFQFVSDFVESEIHLNIWTKFMKRKEHHLFEI